MTTHEKKIQYVKAALALQGIAITERMSDQVIVTLDVIDKKGDDFTLKDAVEIEIVMDRKYKEKALKDDTNP